MPAFFNFTPAAIPPKPPPTMTTEGVPSGPKRSVDPVTAGYWHGLGLVVQTLVPGEGERVRPVSAEMAAKLMAAADLIAERGLDDTKTEDIAAVTGIPKATIYYYFEGKEEVLSFIFGVVLDALHEAVTRAIGGPGPAAERLARV